MKLFDFRRPATSMNQIPIKNEHNGMILKVYLQNNTNKLITASQSGDVKIIDIRTFNCLNTIPIYPQLATCIECHPINELIAVYLLNQELELIILFICFIYFRASLNQKIKIYDFNSLELATIKHHEGFLGKQIANVTCLDWKFDNVNIFILCRQLTFLNDYFI